MKMCPRTFSRPLLFKANSYVGNARNTLPANYGFSYFNALWTNGNLNDRYFIKYRKIANKARTPLKATYFFKTKNCCKKVSLATKNMNFDREISGDDGDEDDDRVPAAEAATWILSIERRTDAGERRENFQLQNRSRRRRGGEGEGGEGGGGGGGGGGGLFRRQQQQQRPECLIRNDAHAANTSNCHFKFSREKNGIVVIPDANAWANPSTSEATH